MFKEWKTKRAKQARVRRAKQKTSLQILKQQAKADGATEKLKTEYLVALKKQKFVVDGSQERATKHIEII